MYIYTFYKNNNINVKIHIAAMTFCEAVDALYSIQPYAYWVYNLKEYRLDELRLYEITKNEYCKLMNIAEDYIYFPIFINDEKYQKLTSKQLYNKNINDDQDNTTVKVIDKLKKIIQHPTNKGINTFLATYGEI